MSPLIFIDWMRERLRDAGIQFAITSGQACVHFGVQQTTKDSDWIIESQDLARLLELLSTWQYAHLLRAAYRGICGSPLDKNYLKNGWTSHLTIDDGQRQHAVDIFSKAPRVLLVDVDPHDPDFASRDVVARMKKTDRDKDWPFVFACGQQLIARGDWRGILHLQEADSLQEVWDRIPESERKQLVWERPLLRWIDSAPRRLPRAIAVERGIWMAVNRQRYRVYQVAWKEWYRRWRDHRQVDWPSTLPLLEQHALLRDAAIEFHLPSDPFDSNRRAEAQRRAVEEIRDIMAVTPQEISDIIPPLEVLLP